jgi:adenylate cyclase
MDFLKTNLRSASIAGVLLLLSVGLALAARYALPLSAGLFEKVELRALDARFHLRGPVSDSQLEKISEQVAIVAMDDAATQKFGHPLPRQTHAQLVAQLRKAGARAIIFDVIFADPSRENPAGDLEFARSIRQAGDVFLPFDHESSQITPEALREHVEEKLSYPIALPGAGSTPDAGAVHIRPPIAPLFFAMRGGGQIASRRDSDGTFRSSILLMQLGEIYPHAVLDAVVKTEWKLDPQETAPCLEDNFLILGGHKIGPLQKRSLERARYADGAESVGAAWAIPLNFLGGHDAMRVLTIPYLDALAGKADARLKNRIVIIGETATGTPDLRRSPFDRQDEFLGVETNATLIANLLNNDFLKYPPLSWAIGISILLGVVCGAAAFRLKPVASLVLAAGVLLAYATLSTWLFINAHLVLEMTAPFLAVALSYTALTALHLMTSEQLAQESQTALRETQTLLGQYVNEGLAAQLSADPELRRDLQIGVRREVTVLFSDIRGFTSWSETQTPEEVKARLDEYFPLMCEIIADDYDGYVDKFIGDGLMAVWNGMSDQENHACCATRAALSMQRALKTLNDGWRKQKQTEFQIGIGIASGSAVFGTFGSPAHKLMPTVLGDVVNLASRLEGMTKEAGAAIIVSQSTYEIIKDDFECRAMGKVPVRGKAEAQPMYEVLASKNNAEKMFNFCGKRV